MRCSDPLRLRPSTAPHHQLTGAHYTHKHTTCFPIVSSTAPVTSKNSSTLFGSDDKSPFSTARGRAGSDTGKGGKPGNRTKDWTKMPVIAIIATCLGGRRVRTMRRCCCCDHLTASLGTHLKREAKRRHRRKEAKHYVCAATASAFATGDGNRQSQPKDEATLSASVYFSTFLSSCGACPPRPPRISHPAMLELDGAPSEQRGLVLRKS